MRKNKIVQGSSISLAVLITGLNVFILIAASQFKYTKTGENKVETKGMNTPSKMEFLSHHLLRYMAKF